MKAATGAVADVLVAFLPGTANLSRLIRYDLLVGLLS